MSTATAGARLRHARAAAAHPLTSGPRSLGVVLLVVSALLAGALGGLEVARAAGSGGWAGVPAVASGWLGGGTRPAMPADVSRAPLALPVRAPSGSGGFRVLELQDDRSGRPVRWDPCRPVHYVIRTRGATPAALAAVHAAIARVEQVTGLRFADDGTTDEAPRADRPAMDQARYGDRWSPVLIAWTDPGEFPGIAGYAGLGGPQSVAGEGPGRRRYVTGLVLFNRDELASIANWDHGSERVQAVVRHEFGHLIGLDHVGDPADLMYPRPDGSPADYAAGDLRGLVALSDGPCSRDF